ncbi:MAG: hypothetical protein ACJAZ0_000766, partial [Halioglobus sp.]
MSFYGRRYAISLAQTQSKQLSKAWRTLFIPTDTRRCVMVIWNPQKKNMSPPPEISAPEPDVDWAIFVPAVFIVLVCAVPLMVFPIGAAQMLQDARGFIMSHFLWLYLLVGIGSLLFCLWLAFGPYGQVKLGAPDEPPEYSDIHWVAM